MRCLSCDYPESKVIDSRPSEDGLSIRRRRECLNCGKRFTTYERHSEATLVVIKSDRSKEPFDRNKLLRSLMIATAKRDVPLATLQNMIDEVETTIRKELKREVHSHVIGDMILERLKEIDDVAYIRFTSVYKDFQDLEEFQAALRSMN